MECTILHISHMCTILHINHMCTIMTNLKYTAVAVKTIIWGSISYQDPKMLLVKVHMGLDVRIQATASLTMVYRLILTQYLPTLQSADDQVVLAGDKENLECMTRKVKKKLTRNWAWT